VAVSHQVPVGLETVLQQGRGQSRLPAVGQVEVDQDVAVPFGQEQLDVSAQGA
jgi:hypothetical protein